MIASLVAGLKITSNYKDTGNRRREIDRVPVDAALSLVCTLAYEQAVAGGDQEVISAVETAILKLRELKVQSIGVCPVLD